MASIKLTKEMRENILTDLVGTKYIKAHKALQPKFAELAMKMYERRFTTSERKKMAAIPKGWLPQDHSIRVVVVVGSGSHDYHELAFSGFSHGTNIHRTKLRLEPKYLTHPRIHDMMLQLGDKDSLALALEKLNDMEKALVEEEKGVRREAMSVLESVTTVGRLLEVWPEATDIFTKYIVCTTGVNLPAKLMTGLNDALGLPPGQRT